MSLILGNLKRYNTMYDFKPPYHGAAYYPEAWPREEIDADLDRLVSHGLNTVRIAEFAWSNMEPEEGKYDFSLFREVVDKCRESGISVVMCTPSATPPSWLEHKYPEIMLEVSGKRSTHGNRRQSCPTNKTFRYFCKRIVEEMGKEFGKDENIIGWQLDNEIAIMQNNIGCNCSSCRQGFTSYLKKRYGTIDALNKAWENYTWSLNFSSFEEVDAVDGSVNLPPCHYVAWEEYKNECYIDFLTEQADILRKYTDKPIGTDMMPTYQFSIDGINKHLDVAQFNHYSGPAISQSWFDTYRCASDRFWITETAPCWSGSNDPLGPRGKGFCRANTLCTFALGGEMVLYWLFRAHKGGHEMAHGSVVDSWGRDMHMSDEIRAISKELELLRPMVQGTKLKNDGLAVIYGQRAYEISKRAAMVTWGVGDMWYEKDLASTAYEPLLKKHYRPDMISADHDLSPYKLLISYRAYTIDEGDFVDRILPWVKNGGTWVVGPMTDIFTKDAAKYRNAPFGHLEDWADITRKFWMPAPNDWEWLGTKRPLTSVILEDGTVLKTKSLIYDAFVAGESARVVGTYSNDGDEYLSGMAAITETKVGKGRIIIMGAALDSDSYVNFIGKIAEEMGIKPITSGDDNVFCSVLEGEYGTVFTAIEGKEKAASIAVPFDSTDILTGRTYSAGETVNMGKYDCIFAKKS